MKILVTGAKGFIGKNLCRALESRVKCEIYEFDIDTREELLDKYCEKCDFVFHLAGVNRPKEQSEFMAGNFGFTSRLLEALKAHGNKCPVMLSSSTQAELNNPYGLSKKAGENLLFRYLAETGARVMIYRFSNVFGKWCKPDYNSVVATFCNNIARGKRITINDRSTVLDLIYIDDVVDELISALNLKPTEKDGFCVVPTVYSKSLGDIADLLYSFRESRVSLNVPDLSDAFTNKLYSTYLSYLPIDEFKYTPRMNKDERGSFTELIRTPDRGQFSVNITKPNITKGNHWHNTKNEKFAVVQGKGLIKLRKVFDNEIIGYKVSGDKIEIIDIPPGYTHNITNIGDKDLITFMWCNECYNPDKPDTYFLEV